MTSGQLVSFFYVTIFLLVPMVSHVLFGQTDWSIYYYTHPAPWVLALLTGLWLLTASPMLRLKVSHVRRPNQKLHKLKAFLSKYTLTLAILITLTVFFLYSPSLLSFRYTGSGVSTGGWKLMLIIMLRSITSIYLMWLLVIFRSQNLNIRLSDRISVWLLAVVLLYTVNGTVSFLSAILFLLFAASPKSFTNLVFTKTTRSLPSVKAIWNFFFLPFLLIALIFSSLIIGEGIKSNKFSLDITVVIFSIKWLAIRLVDGVSSHYYALVQFFDPQTYRILEQYDHPFGYYLKTIEYRTNQLLGFDPVRPNVQSLSRLNFLVNSFKISAREGTSAGPFASFAYIFPLPLALFAALIYLRWVISLIDRFFNLPGFKLTIFGGIFVLQQLLFLYESPLDFLIIIDNLPFLVIILWLFAQMRTDTVLRQALKNSSTTQPQTELVRS